MIPSNGSFPRKTALQNSRAIVCFDSIWIYQPCLPKCYTPISDGWIPSIVDTGWIPRNLTSWTNASPAAPLLPGRTWHLHQVRPALKRLPGRRIMVARQKYFMWRQRVIKYGLTWTHPNHQHEINTNTGVSRNGLPGEWSRSSKPLRECCTTMDSSRSCPWVLCTTHKALVVIFDSHSSI